MTKYHLFVLVGRSTRPRSIGHVFSEAERPVPGGAVDTWTREQLAGAGAVRRWWLVECGTPEEGRAIIEQLQEVYRPDLPAIPADIRRRVRALGRG